MPLWLFEGLCVVVIALTLAATARSWADGGGRAWPALLRDYAALAVAGWVGEQTSIALYHHYSYASGWHARVLDVPLLVPLIWPLVILSARDVAQTVWPRVERWRPLVVGAVVFVDASMVEVLAVSAGLWSWAEPGHLGVPLIGILGWAFFAVSADVVLPSQGRRDAVRGGAGATAGPARHLALVVLAPLATHGLLALSWWGGLRWVLRGELAPGSLYGMAAASIALLWLVLAARRRGHGMPPRVAGPRVIAALLFFALLLTSARDDLALWAHVAAVALPYAIATKLPRAPRPEPSPRSGGV